MRRRQKVLQAGKQSKRRRDADDKAGIDPDFEQEQAPGEGEQQTPGASRAVTVERVCPPQQQRNPDAAGNHAPWSQAFQVNPQYSRKRQRQGRVRSDRKHNRGCES